MPLLKAKSILGTGDKKDDVEREADVIFTAAFIGMTLFQNVKSIGKKLWQLDMEPNTDPPSKKTREDRTKDDRASMKTLNDVCSKVTQVVRAHTKKNEGGVKWGLSPTFDRGGMICAGQGAQYEYAQVNRDYAKTAYVYLTAPQQATKDDKREGEMYVGRGAYCGLVIDKDGNAINAMSTIRWSINDQTPGVGDRWSPPIDSEVFKAQQKGDGALWGMITPPDKTSVEAANEMKQLGMRFFPKNNYGASGNEVVAYTHGMIRCVYETARIGQGTAFEMSIGTDTFKLSSCLPCSSFMMANNVDASSSHLGRGESWSPYFAHDPESHNYSYVADEKQKPLQDAIDKCNKAYAEHMHEWLTDGVKAMLASLTWVDTEHGKALNALSQKLQGSKKDNTVARDLFLDAVTFHKTDSKRLQDTLVYDTKTAKSPCDGTFDWYQGKQTGNGVKGSWETFVNPLTDEQVAALHADPMQLGANKQKMLTPATTLQIKSESESDMLDGKAHVGLAIGLTSHQGPSALVIPDIQGVKEGMSPVYLAKPLSLRLESLAKYVKNKTGTDLKTVGAESGQPPARWRGFLQVPRFQ